MSSSSSSRFTKSSRFSGSESSNDGDGLYEEVDDNTVDGSGDWAANWGS